MQDPWRIGPAAALEAKLPSAWERGLQGSLVQPPSRTSGRASVQHLMSYSTLLGLKTKCCLEGLWRLHQGNLRQIC